MTSPLYLPADTAASILAMIQNGRIDRLTAFLQAAINAPKEREKAKGKKRSGEGHHRARLTDREVAQMREIRDAQPHADLATLAIFFGVSYDTARSITSYRRRV